MKMSDVKFGMRLRSTYPNDKFGIVTVVEITPGGFRYTHAPQTVKLREYEYGTCSGGEHFGLNGEAFYEVVDCP